MYAARIVEQGTADEVFLEPRAPLHDRPDALDPAARPAARHKLETIEGLPPDLRKPPAGCRFAPRCPYRLDACTQDVRPRRGRARTHARPASARARSSPARWCRRRTTRDAGTASSRRRRRAAARRRSPEEIFHREGGGRRLPVAQDRDGESGRRRLDPRPGGRDARARRRVRLRQDHGRPLGAAARRADRRHDPFRRRRHHAREPTPTCAACGARSR